MFVAQLIKYLQAANFITLQAVGDTDTLIAETALQVAATTGPVTVVADDTDVLVLLVHHAGSPSHGRCFHAVREVSAQ